MKKFIRYSILLFLISVIAALQSGCYEDQSLSIVSESSQPNVTSGLPRDFNDPLVQITDRSDFAAKGKVIEKEVLMSSDQNPVPHTVVTFEVLDTLFGGYEDNYGNNTLSIKFVQGEYPDGRYIDASHNPKGLDVGKEVFFFVNQKGHEPCGFTECENGVFIINEENHIIASNGATVAFDDQGKSRFIAKRHRDESTFKGLLAQNHVGAFAQRIKDIANKASDRAKAHRVNIKGIDKTQPLFGSPSLYTPTVGPYDNAENERRQAESKAAYEKGYAGLSDAEKWELRAYRENGNNPVITDRYRGE